MSIALSHVIVDKEKNIYLVSQDAETFKVKNFTQTYDSTITCKRLTSVIDKDDIVFLHHAEPYAPKLSFLEWGDTVLLSYPFTQEYKKVAAFLEGERFIDVNLDSIWELPPKSALSYNYDY